MPPGPQLNARLKTLDLIRGFAVLGILAINIAGFAGPRPGTISPALVTPLATATSALDPAAYAFSLLFFEGKMRALFSILFGAGIVLFCEHAEARGENGEVLQVRRLFWLMVLGMAHYLLLWWGDILFVYAICGLFALMLRGLNDRALLVLSIGLLYGWHLWGLFELAPLVHAETALREGSASLAQSRMVADWYRPVVTYIQQEMAEARMGYFQLVLTKLTHRPLWLLAMVWGSFAETLPLMLIGVVLYRRGFFSGAVRRDVLRKVGLTSLASGLGLTAAFTLWAWHKDFAPIAMEAALAWGLVLPHLLSALGYAAVLVLVAPQITETALGQRIMAAGQMAFSNYIGTSLVMCALFQGWGLGLFARFGPAAQWLFVLLGWALMLAWSAPWLQHFRRGPLEWLWRSLVEKRPLQNRR